MRCSNWGGAFCCRFKRALYRLPHSEPLSPQGVESPRGIVTYGRGYESATGSFGGGSVAGLAGGCGAVGFHASAHFEVRDNSSSATRTRR
jgi:hypothetical protein